MLRTAIVVAGLISAAGWAGGCTSSPYGLNNELTVGAKGNGREPSYTPETLKPTFGAPAAAPQAGPPPAPSTVSIDRRTWEVTRVDVPNDRPSHQPIYTRSVIENTEIARNRGVYPTAASANQLSHRTSEERQQLEAVEAPIAAAADVVLFLPRMIMNPPWETAYSGFEPYRRSPSPRASVSLVLAGPKAELPKPAPGRMGITDPGAAPVRVPVGEYEPVK